MKNDRIYKKQRKEMKLIKQQSTNKKEKSTIDRRQSANFAPDVTHEAATFSYSNPKTHEKIKMNYLIISYPEIKNIVNGSVLWRGF